jgi:hypothetical protein
VKYLLLLIALFAPYARAQGNACAASGNFVGIGAAGKVDSTTLVFSRPVLTAANTGMTVVVHGAGANGGPLVSTITYVNNTTASLAVAAATPVVNAWVGMGTDDTESIRKCVATAKSQQHSVSLPTPGTKGACYLVTKSLDMGGGGGLWIVGDGPGVGFGSPTICHALTEAYPVLDFSGSTRSGIRDITVAPVNNDLSNSLATSGVYAKPATGGQSPILFSILSSEVIAGNSRGSAACIVSAVDQSVFQNSTCKSNYVGLVVGNGAGTTTSSSKYYTMGKGYGDTLISILNCTIEGSQDTPLELDGSSDFEVGGNTYVVMGGAGTDNVGVTGGHLINVHQGGSYEWNKLHLTNMRTENQSKATGVTALYLDGASATHAGTIDATLNTDHGGYAIGGPGTLSFYTINMATSASTVFNKLGGMFNTDFRLSTPVANWGSIGKGPFGFKGNTIHTGFAIPAVLNGIPHDITTSQICSNTDCQNFGPAAAAPAK